MYFYFHQLFSQYLEPLSYIKKSVFCVLQPTLIYIYKWYELFSIIKWSFPTMHNYSKYYTNLWIPLESQIGTCEDKQKNINPPLLQMTFSCAKTYCTHDGWEKYLASKPGFSLTQELLPAPPRLPCVLKQRLSLRWKRHRNSYHCLCFQRHRAGDIE